MSYINLYVAFNGNCREAMTFYNDGLDSELTFQTIRESPLADKMPEQMKNCILYATLITNHLVIMTSDMVGEKGLIKGNNVSLKRNQNNNIIPENFLKTRKRPPLENTFWEANFGNFTDKFGNHWLLHFQTNKKNMKTIKIIYWTTTIIIFLLEGVMPALTSNTELAKQGISHLGYPDYFRILLAIFKVAGALTLILPMLKGRIKEWAYAGFTFNFICAAVSHTVVDGLGGNTVFPIVVLLILAGSYVCYHKLADFSPKTN